MTMGVPDGEVDLSVVIAAFDAAATLPEQLAALAGQRTSCAWEVVLADNGSRDGTVNAALAFATRLPALRVVDASARRGPAAARNAGVRAARGRHVVFCDADDVVGEGWLQAMHEALRRHDFVAGRLDGRRLNAPDVRASRTLPQSRGLQESALLPGLWHAGAGNMGVRADLFRRMGGFDESARCLEDTDLCWRMGLVGVRLVYVEDAVVHARLREGLRVTARQGYQYGAGERWLAERYAAVARAVTARPERLAAVPDSGPPNGGAAARRPGPRPSAGRQVGRVLRRVSAIAAELARVRGRGDLQALCWSTAWGLGFALGRGPQPVPVAIPPEESRAA
ncbi:glycosyltransferase family 2 protein [Cellulomonas chengniuliangii]|uniref:Glycosyltransferase family 2 protein n=1 Tax=Cellulomonas chengniuliangii TaxID=2968084 RepID=A0ABY5L2G4_9CELL|nr:glycosyltransferase family A protein [Cellulomonas chengniuliangii]MCC2307119.1 glycosyltransferase family 2 protein [Cellulomonas chengniuliangii]UUI76083.1 glycosyltransferase family 2 protein [Cellulomonas chengniuliangii]